MSLPAELKTGAALHILGVGLSGARALNDLPSHLYRGSHGRPPRMFRTDHVLAVKRIMDEADLGIAAAVRVLVAQLEVRL